MFERFRRHGGNGYEERERGGVATASRPRGTPAADETAHHDRNGEPGDERTAVRERPRTAVRDHDPVREPVAARAGGPDRARERFGGVNWGAAFFGWLVAIGLSVILLALVSAAGAAIGLTSVSGSEARDNAETISLVGAILLLAILLTAYYAGGYVAGRMSRFDGGRQGAATWIIGLLVTIVLAIAGAIGGSKYNVLSGLNLPRIPVDEGTLATGGAIALAAAVLGTLLAAFVGGKAGQRYHRRVDRAAWAES